MKKWFRSTTRFIGRTHLFAGIAVEALAVSQGIAQGREDVRVDAALVTGTPLRVEIRVSIPPKYYLYADMFKVEGLDGTQLAPEWMPEPTRRPDPTTQEVHPFFGASFTGRFVVVSRGPSGVGLAVEWQACDESQCFFPERREWRFRVDSGLGIQAAKPTPGAGTAGASAENEWIPPDFRVARRAAGYMGERAFLEFLEGRDASAGLLRHGWWAAIALILLGGVLLNFTPCVLPLIPINLGILATVAKGRSRREGAVVGAIYGWGMAVAYGLLGVVVVRFGAAFGSINASPWFNAFIAVLFAVLSLAMFEVIELDFSRFQSRVDTRRMLQARYLGVLALGAVSAVLAGACVAPVLVSVLLLATSLYQAGVTLAVLLPFLLGLGMALPWPLAAAGLARLPRPGPWMTAVRYGFGVVIAVLAIWYGSVAWRLWRGPTAGGFGAENGQVVHHDLRTGFTARDWAAVFEDARTSGRPILVDFWATWCKNCHAMDATTLRRPSVRQHLQTMVVVRCQLEQPDAEPAASVRRAFGVPGLPTYVILTQVPSAGQL